MKRTRKDDEEFQQYIDWINASITQHIKDGEQEIAEALMDTRDDQVRIHWEKKSGQ